MVAFEDKLLRMWMAALRRRRPPAEALVAVRRDRSRGVRPKRKPHTSIASACGGAASAPARPAWRTT